MESYVKLVIVGIMPGLLTILFLLLEKTGFSRANKNVKQVIYGVTFGLLAVLGTEYGIPTNGAATNARDAAVLTAGLMFGGPAGIIAGLIGGIERWFSVYWGVGAYTRLACSVSTALAGVYSAVLRKYMFDETRPSWLMAFAVGLVMEVFHLTMVFLTHMDDTRQAMAVVKACSIAMFVVNSVAVMISSFFCSLMSVKEKEENENTYTVTQLVQRWMLVSVVLAFVVTTLFMFRLESTISDETTKQYLAQGIEDVKSDVEDASDRNLLLLTEKAISQIGVKSIEQICDEFDISELSYANKDGIIFESSVPEYIGFNFDAGEQSREFLCLLNGTDTYVQQYGPISRDAAIYRKYAGVATDFGFIQVGYDAQHFQNDLKEEVDGVTKNRHIGTEGYVIIANSNYEIVSQPEGRSLAYLKDYGIESTVNTDEVLSGVVDGEECFYMVNRAEGYTIVSVYPEDEALHTRNVALYANSFMQVLVFAVMFAMIYALIKVVIVRNVRKINNSLTKITNGDLDQKVNMKDVEEFISLSGYINTTVDTLKTYINEAKHKIEAELENAKNIQNSALNHNFPLSERFEIFALMEPAKEVGGDFYDFFRTGKDKLNFLVADVSGKGIPGAMFMMRAKSELHSLAETGIEVNDVFTYGNASLCENNDAGMFVTAWQGVVDLNTGHITYANAGHNPPVIIRTDGTVEYIRGKAGFVLAGMDGVKYKPQELQMEPGDIIFLYTDGVVEATNLEHELYGEDRLVKCLEEADKAYGMEYLCCEVIGDVGRFVGDAEQFDDITMMALMYKGPLPEKEESQEETL